LEQVFKDTKLTTAKDMLYQAERLFDKGQYGKAAELYQQTLLLEEPVQGMGSVSMLVDAWETMHLVSIFKSPY
jgi:hypothetical protein